MKGYQIIFAVVWLNLNIFGVGSQSEESYEETLPNYEYIQIFKSIPTLFEYLLDALEERPEILEKNDVTIFNRNIDGEEIEECEDSDNEKKMEKRDADCGSAKAEDEPSNKINKRDTSSTTNIPETTVAYEYGNSNVVMKGLERMEGNNVISKEHTITDNFNNFFDKQAVKKELLKREDRIHRKKRSVLSKLDEDINDLYRSYGEMFLGFEHLFGLDLKPEEIEERILTAEKLLEDHNNKKVEK